LLRETKIYPSLFPHSPNNYSTNYFVFSWKCRTLLQYRHLFNYSSILKDRIGQYSFFDWRLSLFRCDFTCFKMVLEQEKILETKLEKQ
jgi:hypothetical protein